MSSFPLQPQASIFVTELFSDLLPDFEIKVSYFNSPVEMPGLNKFSLTNAVMSCSSGNHSSCSIGAEYQKE